MPDLPQRGWPPIQVESAYAYATQTRLWRFVRESFALRLCRRLGVPPLLPLPQITENGLDHTRPPRRAETRPAALRSRFSPLLYVTKPGKSCIGKQGRPG